MIPFFVALSPEFKLLERETQLSTLLLLIVIFCFFLIGWSGMRTNGFFSLLVKNFFKFSTKEKEFKETLKINFGSNLLLTINFFLSLSLCVFLVFQNYLSVWNASILAIVSSFLFLFLQQFGFRFVAFLAGVNDITDAIVSVNRNVWQFGGVVLLVLATIWTLNLNQNTILTFSFFVILSLMLLLRIIKGLLLSFKKRIRWYYFILYLCTLEILPALVFVKLALGFFQWEM
jgi:hypothetical protein